MYQQLATQFYELAKTAEDACAEIAFYAAYAEQAGGLILEPMCGSGRILLPLLARGYPIEGFDASAPMLQVVQEKCAALGVHPVPVWQQWLHQFNNQKKYHLIIIPFGSFGLVLCRAQALAALQTLRAHLVVGGTLIIEIDTVFSVTGAQGVVRRATRQRADGTIVGVSAVVSYDDQTRIFTSRSRYELIENGKVIATEDELFEQYLYHPDEFAGLLLQAGFLTHTVYTDYTKEAAGAERAPLLLYVVS